MAIIYVTYRRIDDKENADRPALTEIEITPEMIEAGVRAYYDCDRRVFDPESLVAVIFEEMAIAGKRLGARP